VDDCVACPLHSTTLSRNSTAFTDCVCASGYFDDRRTVPVPVPLPSDVPNATAGASSDLMTAAVAAAATELASEEATEPSSAPEAFCRVCFVGTRCPEGVSGLTRATLPLDPGYYRPTTESIDVQRCPDAERSCGQQASATCSSGCRGGDDPSRLCNGELFGTFCQLCPTVLNGTNGPSFYKVASSSEGSHCEPCKDTIALTVGVLCGALACVLLLMLILLPRALYYWEHDVSARWKKLAARFWRTTTPHNKLKILYGFYFIACKLPSVYQAQFPPNAKATLTGLEMVIYLGADQIATPLTCVGLGGYAAKLTFAILAPILLVSLLLLGSTCKALCESCSESGRQGEQRFSWEKVAEGAAPLTLRLLFLAYPFVTSIAFEAWVCDEFEEGAWLRADVSIKCGVGMAGHGSPAHASAISLAALGILIYPVGIMVGFGGLLYAARKAIIDERPTRLSNALQFLHREYVPICYWWEMMEMARRVLLVGLLLVVVSPGSVLQAVVAQLANTAFLFVQMRANPYRMLSDDWLAQFCTLGLSGLFAVCVLIKILELTELDDIQAEMSAEQRSAYELTGTNGTIWACLVGTVVATGLLLISQVRLESERLRKEARAAKARRLRYIDNDQEVTLKKPRARSGFHIFLSHVWGTGQDQMRVVKQRLLEMVPDMRVFLDVDDLADISELEAYIDRSEKVLVFCSRGYFQSRNCMRELRAAVTRKKPLLALFEPDRAKGLKAHEVREQLTEGWRDEEGIFHPVGELYEKWGFAISSDGGRGAESDAGPTSPKSPKSPKPEEGPPPNALAAALFASWPIEWNRIGCFQDVTLRLLAEHVLPSGARPTFVQDELSNLLPPILAPADGRRFHLYCSPFNAGAVEVATEVAQMLSMGVRLDGDATQSYLSRAAADLLHAGEESVESVKGGVKAATGKVKAATGKAKELAERGLQGLKEVSEGVKADGITHLNPITRLPTRGKAAPASRENSPLRDPEGRPARDGGKGTGGKGTGGKGTGGRRTGGKGTPKGTPKGTSHLLISTNADDLEQCEHMLLYLNGKTWTSGEATDGLAEHVEAALAKGVHVLCAHEMPGHEQHGRHASEFEAFFHETPAGLLKAGVYKEIAVPFKGGQWRAVSRVLLAKALVRADNGKFASLGQRIIASTMIQRMSRMQRSSSQSALGRSGSLHAAPNRLRLRASSWTSTWTDADPSARSSAADEDGSFSQAPRGRRMSGVRRQSILLLQAMQQAPPPGSAPSRRDPGRARQPSADSELEAGLEPKAHAQRKWRASILGSSLAHRLSRSRSSSASAPAGSFVPGVNPPPRHASSVGVGISPALPAAPEPATSRGSWITPDFQPRQTHVVSVTTVSAQAASSKEAFHGTPGVRLPSPSRYPPSPNRIAAEDGVDEDEEEAHAMAAGLNVMSVERVRRLGV